MVGKFSDSTFTRLVIVEDDEMHLGRFKTVFGKEKDFNIVGTFQNPLEALERMENLAPDILLTDIHMPDMNGLELIKLVHERLPEIVIVALSLSGDSETVRKAILAGASGYLLKTEPSAKLCERLREVINDGAAFSPSCAASMVRQMQSVNETGKLLLTAREREILLDIGDGNTYKETASRFGLSLHTIHNHVKNIFEKLNVNKKCNAIRVAKSRGFI